MILIILYTYLINDVPIAGQAPGQYRLHLSALGLAGAGARHPGHSHRVGATRGHRGGASLSNSPGDHHVYNSHLQQETRLESQYHVHVHHAQFGLDFRGFRSHCHIFVDIISPQAVTVPVLTSEDCSNQPGATPPSPDQVSRKTGNMYSQECVFSINIIF